MRIRDYSRILKVILALHFGAWGYALAYLDYNQICYAEITEARKEGKVDTLGISQFIYRIFLGMVYGQCWNKSCPAF